MQKSLGFKHVIFIAVVVFLSLWTWMFRYEVMRLDNSGRFLLDRFTGKTYIAGGVWREIKFYTAEPSAQDNKKALSEEYEEFLKEKFSYHQSADSSTNRRTKP